MIKKYLIGIIALLIILTKPVVAQVNSIDPIFMTTTTIDEQKARMIESITTKKTLDNYQLKYHGFIQDKNLIVIQVPGLQSFIINQSYHDQEITPIINQLLNDQTITFSRFYNQVGEDDIVSNEFVKNNSLYPLASQQKYDLYKDNNYYGLPKMLKDEDYQTSLLIALDTFDSSTKKSLYLSDYDYIQATHDFSDYKRYDLYGDKLFHRALKTIQSKEGKHYVSIYTDSLVTSSHKRLRHKNFHLKSKDQSSALGQYILKAHTIDQAIGDFIKQLKNEQLYDNSIIIIQGVGEGLSAQQSVIRQQVEQLTGEPFAQDDQLQVPLLVHIPELIHGYEIKNLGGTIDLMPTMNNLLGIDSSDYYALGRDLFNDKKEIVLLNKPLVEGSYISKDVIYTASSDGIYSNGECKTIGFNKTVSLKAFLHYYDKGRLALQQSATIIKDDSLPMLVRQQYIFKSKPKTSKQINAWIAHAGGAIDGETYTNSKDAIEESLKKGFKLIEVDFEWTSDHELVLLHSWDGFVNKFFNQKAFYRYSLDEFKSFDMFNGYSQLTLDDLPTLFQQYPEVTLVTDIKGDNIKGLGYIALAYPEIMDQLIPQVYSMEEYDEAKALGYKNIIFTLYKTTQSNEEIVDFCKENKEIYAITMPVNRVKTGLSKELSTLGVTTYTHTINDLNDVDRYKGLGINGVYTDYLFGE